LREDKSLKKLPFFFLKASRRRKTGVQNGTIYDFSEFRLIPDDDLLLRNGLPIRLPPKAYETLALLVERHGHLVKKSELIDKVWDNAFVEEAAVSRCVWTIRTALGEDSKHQHFIQTVPKRGYKFVGQVSIVDEQRPVIETNGNGSSPPASVQVFRGAADQVTNGTRNDIGRSPRATTGSRILAGFGILGLAIGVAILGYFLLGLSASPSTVRKYFAVLPPKPIEPSNRVELYELGVADALILRLNSIDGFIARPLSETRKYTEIDQDPISVGREQKADYVLAPNYQLAEGKIRITTQLWNVATGQVEDSYIFQKTTSGIFAIQDAMAADIANKLVYKFGRKLNGPPAKWGTNNEEAYRFYQMGMAYADKAGSNFARAIESLNKAVELDPNYADAWAGLARVVRPGYGKGLQTEEEHVRSLDAINKALSIDPQLADAYVSLCDARLFYDYDAAAAEAACKRALELDPNSADAHLTYSTFLNSRLRMDEAFAENKAAMDLAPASFRIQRQYANNLYTARRYAEAEEQYKLLIDFNPEGRKVIYRRLVRTLEAEGKESEAFDYLIKLEPLEGGDDTTVAHLKEAYASSGWRGVTEERIRLSHRDPMAGAFWRAQWFAYLGDNDKALENLEECLRNRSLMMMFLRGESHYFDSLLDDPRFENLVRRIEGS
jgi:DNA-binding winged helix-turn-helix (wHTH) protein/tetratricopeptide (TPR) repeat protein